MDRHLQKQTSFRFTDETLIAKLNVIAKKNKRNRNQQVEWILDKYVGEYEAEYGEIPIDDAISQE